MFKLPCEYLIFLDLEGAAVWSPGCLEEVDRRVNELHGYADRKVMQVKGKAQDHIDWGNKGSVELVSQDRVLSEHDVGLSQQEKTAMMLAAIACLKRWVLATSRKIASST